MSPLQNFWLRNCRIILLLRCTSDSSLLFLHTSLLAAAFVPLCLLCKHDEISCYSEKNIVCRWMFRQFLEKYFSRQAAAACTSNSCVSFVHLKERYSSVVVFTLRSFALFLDGDCHMISVFSHL